MQGKSKLIWRIITILVVVFFLFAGAYFVLTAGSDSKRLEQALIDQYGWTGDYVPAADGFIPPDRLQRFVRIRRAVQPNCASYQEILDGIVGLAAIEDDPEITGGESASRGMKAFKSMVTVGPEMLSFMDARNSNLLKEEMSIGEYMHLYLVTYGQKLPTAANSPYSEMEEAWLSERIMEDYAQILRNQVSALDPGTSSAIADTLRREIAELEEDPRAMPWSEGPLPRTRESIAPYQDQLSDLYCDGLVSIELLQKRRKFTFGE